jgi:hypothetical protein
MDTSVGLLFISLINTIFLAILAFEVMKIRKMMASKHDRD